MNLKMKDENKITLAGLVLDAIVTLGTKIISLFKSKKKKDDTVESPPD